MSRVLPFLSMLLATMMVSPAGAAIGDPKAEAHFSGLAGQLLVAEPSLDDPNFAHTVVLIVQHDSAGALGLVVNRPYGTAPTAELLSRLGVQAETVKGDTLLFYGGPVQPSVGMVVHSTDYALPETRRVTADIAVTSNRPARPEERGSAIGSPMAAPAGETIMVASSMLRKGSTRLTANLPAGPTRAFRDGPM
ncbi:MAG: YqgE/AlgH family protein, partial [Geminicoccaceae bacterium]